ncbi:hypothetical protein JIX56_19635 [Streptomyces sp. CA-210063]|uniref:hypothetical protein n=1 Tax=Streptomyces sp. CA-210063 TaxID=2801029 RepID=UPI00214A8CA3|nr:hypothetical protein [Streptomyces sp. CA-210063]UUU31934.1 hypothetical protein JIX56_19635 [Streptomyces sp. CA-210063]
MPTITAKLDLLTGQQLLASLLDACGGLVTYRAEHLGAHLGIYTRFRAASEHCEDEARSRLVLEGGTAKYLWFRDEEDENIAELHVEIDGVKTPTGNKVIVTATPNTYQPRNAQ